MYANTYVQLAHKENVLTIPLSAIQGQGADTTVAVLDGQNRVQIRKVQIGLRGSLLAEVISGINQGDRVVLDDASRYKSGGQVTPRVQPEPANDVMHDDGGMTDPQASQPAAGNGGNQ